MKKKKLIYEKQIREIMLRIGLFYDDLSIDDDLQQIFTESLVFITFIIELEQEFDIEIPEQYLNPEMLGSFRQLDNLLCDLISDKKQRGWNKIKAILKRITLKIHKLA